MSFSLGTENGDDIITEGGDEIMARQALRDAVLAAVRAKLQQVIPDVPVDRARRAPVAREEFPRLVVVGADAVPDQSRTPHLTHWDFQVLILGYVAGGDDEDAEAELSLLHARLMQALEIAELGDFSIMVTPGPAEMELLDTARSSWAAAKLAVGISVLASAVSGYPYAV